MPKIEDAVLVELHRAASLAGRPGIVIPSRDLAGADQLTGNRARTKAATGRLVRAGKVLPVRRDLLVMPDQTGIVTASLVDLIEAVAPRPYLITGGRALQAHDLTDQHYFSVTTLVPGRVDDFSYRGESTAFLTTAPERIWGAARDTGPQYASVERALLDALSHARYGVSIAQAAGVLRLGAQRDQDLLGRLLGAVRRYGEAATARRVGLLVDSLFGWDAAAPFATLVGTRRAAVPLRPNGPADGVVDTRWRVLVNVDLWPEDGAA